MSQSSGPVASFESPLTSFESVDLLADEIRSTCPAPVNRLQITALLESAGVTDAMATRRYGFSDVFALAQGVSQMISNTTEAVRRRPAATVPETDWRAVALDYLRGPLGVLPLLLLMAIIGVYQDFGQWEASRVLTLSASTIGSLLVTSGFVQVASRKGSSFLSQGYAMAAARFVIRVGGIALAVVVVTGLLLCWAARAMGWLAPADAPLMLASYTVLSCLWLLSAGLSIFKQVHWFGVALGLGVGASRVALVWLADAVPGQQMAIAIATGLGFVVTAGVGVWATARAVSRAAEAAEGGNRSVRVPPLPQLAVNLAPYFGYGIAYILSVLSGHVGGWVGRLPNGLARMDAIATSELALTIALLGYILVGGVAEQTMQRFWQRVHVFQDRALASQPEMFAGSLKAFQRDERRRFVMALLISTAAVVIFVAVSLASSPRGVLLGMTLNLDLVIVLASGLVGCALLGVAAFDCMMLITLSRPWPALQALVAGTVATFVVSLTLGLTVGYSFGALGMIVGNAIVLVVARRQLGQVIRHADYFYFTSF